MGIAIIGGLISSTILTLVVVPAAFGYIDDFRLWMLRLFTRKPVSSAKPQGHAAKLEQEKDAEWTSASEI